jgi:hypothetical protein
VIRADLDFTDLDPVEWAVLNELVLEARRLRRWGYVLHADGQVLSRHPSDVGVTPGEAVGHPAQLAQRLRAEGEFDRVVVIDRARLPALARAGAELVEPDGDLTRYRERVDGLYWSSPAVVTDPAPPANPWLEMRLCTEALGAGLVHVLVYDDGHGGCLRTALSLRVQDGSVTRISSPAGDDVPDVVLAITGDQLVAALRSDDLVSQLLDGASRHPRTRGLGRLSAHPPSPSTGTDSPTTAQEGLTVHAS